MTQPSPPTGGLALLAEAFRSKRTGLLVFGGASDALRVRLEEGQIVALGPAPAEASAATPMGKPNDSVRLRLERVLSEIGMRKRDAEAPASGAPPATLRDRLIARLADDTHDVRFEEGEPQAQDLVAVAVATEPLILEAVRQIRHELAVRAALGDLDRRLVATTALADERTLTLTEGYLLSRIDGLLSARQVLQLVPLDTQETERTLLGLVLTGRVACRPAPATARPTHPRVAEREPAPDPEAPAPEAPAPEAASDAAPGADQTPPAVETPAERPAVLSPTLRFAPPPAQGEDAVVGTAPEPMPEAMPEPVPEAYPEAIGEPVPEGFPEPIAEAVPEPIAEGEVPYDPAPAQPVAAQPLAEAAPDAPTAPLPVQLPKPPLDAGAIARRREILEFFQALPLKNHFEVLGVEPGCTDPDVRRAYVTLVKRFHPDSQRDSRLEDLHDILEAITIRVGEAWEVLGEARSRASYESRSGIVRRSSTRVEPQASSSSHGATAPSEPAEYVSPEEILHRARRLVAQARYWDAIQMLESALPRMEPPVQQHRGRLLLARAYSKNPNWLRRAEEMLHELLREDPTNADVHYELGLLYKTGGFLARAHGMFKRALELRPGHKEASAELGIQAAAESGGGGLLKRLFKRGRAS